MGSFIHRDSGPHQIDVYKAVKGKRLSSSALSSGDIFMKQSVGKYR